MKRLLLLIFLQSAGLLAVAQNFKPTSTSDVAAFGMQKFHNDESKIFFAYSWVVRNIRYDAEKALAINRGVNARAIIDSAFKRRKGVCENFAAIFSDICQKMGFQSFVINGYSRQNGSVDRQPHSWSTVKIDGDWFLFDPTWDVGKSGPFNFFKRSGADFIASHMPFDPIWQLLESPISHADFYRGQLTGHSKVTFNFSDSLDIFITMDSLARYQSSLKRIESAGLYDQKIVTNYKIVKNDLEMERQDEQLRWYNAAVQSMNEAKEQLNNFIDYRNNQFLPEKPGETIYTMLGGIDEKLQKAFLWLDQVDKSEAILVMGTAPAREQLQKLRARVKEQQKFLKEFLASTSRE